MLSAGVMSSEFEQVLGARLTEFSAHGLEDLDRANLMNRVDTKFLVDVRDLPGLIGKLEGHYSILEIDNRRIFRYQSTYFDTDNFLLYHLHHNKCLNRHKVRLRHYVDDDSHFLEVKFKTNKRRTVKSRIQVEGSEALDISAHQSFLHGAGLPTSVYLKPRLLSQYRRIAFASEARVERLTIDINLVKHSLEERNRCSVNLHGLAVVELKQARLDHSSPFFRCAREMNCRATGFSKYCMGVALTMQDNQLIKRNRFKRITRKVMSSTIESS